MNQIPRSHERGHIEAVTGYTADRPGAEIPRSHERGHIEAQRRPHGACEPAGRFRAHMSAATLKHAPFRLLSL